MTAQTYTGPSGALKKDSAWLSSEDFTLPFERVVCVAGPSSSGKSTSIATAPRVNTGRSSLRYTSSVTRVLAWPTRWAMSSSGIPELESSDTKLCRSSLGVQDIGFIPAAATTRRKALRTLAGSSGEPVVVENTRSNSSSWRPLSALCFSTATCQVWRLRTLPGRTLQAGDHDACLPICLPIGPPLEEVRVLSSMRHMNEPDGGYGSELRCRGPRDGPVSVAMRRLSGARGRLGRGRGRR